MRDDLGDEGDEDMGGMPPTGEQAPFGTRDPQPYLPRDAQFFPPRDQPQYGGGGGRPQQQQHHQPQQPRGEDDGNVERLPSFITGGAGGAQGAAQGGAQGNGQNGYDAQQGDRFPLHRRRRRHRGPRDMGQSGGGHSMSEGDDAPQNRGE